MAEGDPIQAGFLDAFDMIGYYTDAADLDPAAIAALAVNHLPLRGLPLVDTIEYQLGEESGGVTNLG